MFVSGCVSLRLETNCVKVIGPPRETYAFWYYTSVDKCVAHMCIWHSRIREGPFRAQKWRNKFRSYRLSSDAFFRITCVDNTVAAVKSIIFTRSISRQVALSFINSLSLEISKDGARPRKDGAWPALFHISCYLCCSVVICVFLCIVCV